MFTQRIATLAAILAGAAVGLAAPASAELLDGTYEVTNYTSSSGAQTGGSKTWVISSCGAGCKRVNVPGDTTGGNEYHLQGNTWTCITPSGATVYTIDDTSLVGSVGMPGDDTPDATYQLVKAG